MTRFNLRKKKRNRLAIELTRRYVIAGLSAAIGSVLEQSVAEQFAERCHCRYDLIWQGWKAEKNPWIKKKLDERHCETCLTDLRIFRTTLVLKEKAFNCLGFSKRCELYLFFKCTSQGVQIQMLKKNEFKLLRNDALGILSFLKCVW